MDFAIISIKQEERDAITDRFRPLELRECDELAYLFGHLETQRGRRTVAIARSIHQGQNAAHRVAASVITDLDPSWILVVGIAGGVPGKDVTLGDVVVSRSIHELDVGLDYGDEIHVRGGDVHRDVEKVLSTLSNDNVPGWNVPERISVTRPGVDAGRVNVDEPGISEAERDWRRELKQSLDLHFHEGTPGRGPRWKDGAIATSNKLIKDWRIARRWQTFLRQFLAIEMESGGVYEASRTGQHSYPLMTIRGISDIVGLTRDPAWTSYACHTAAAFAHAFVKSGLGPPPRPVGWADVEVTSIEQARRHQTQYAQANALPTTLDVSGLELQLVPPATLQSHGTPRRFPASPGQASHFYASCLPLSSLDRAALSGDIDCVRIADVSRWFQAANLRCQRRLRLPTPSEWFRAVRLGLVETDPDRYEICAVDGELYFASGAFRPDSDALQRLAHPRNLLEAGYTWRIVLD